MYRIYGSEMCPDCINCKKNFDNYNIDYEYLDVCSSLRILKEFLVIRDKEEKVFARCKEIHDIGLPTLVDLDDNNRVFISWEKLLEDKGLEVIDYVKDSMHSSCSLDGKGC